MSDEDRPAPTKPVHVLAFLAMIAGLVALAAAVLQLAYHA